MKPVPPLSRDNESSRLAVPVNGKFAKFGILSLYPALSGHLDRAAVPIKPACGTDSSSVCFHLSTIYSQLIAFPHHVLHIPSGRVIAIHSRSCPDLDSANFLHGLLRAEICFSDKEHHVLDKLERMIQQ